MTGRGRACRLLGLLGLLAVLPLSCRAAPPSCGRTVIALPILSENGAVVVPAAVDGVPVAAEVNPRAFPGFVIDPTGLSLPRLGFAAPQVLAGRERGFETVLDRLQLGDAVFPGLHAVALAEPARPLVDGRRVAIVLGADVLDRYAMLMDLPNRRLLLFGPGGDNCADPAALLPGRPVSVPLREGEGGRIDVVDAVLDGAPVPMEINPSSNDTIIPRAVARRLGLADAILDRDPRVRTQSGGVRAGGVRVGWRHGFDGLALGGAVLLRAPRVDVLPDLNYAVLGLDALAGRTLLFDFPGRRLWFDPAAPVPPNPGRASALSNVRTRDAATAVQQESPPPR